MADKSWISELEKIKGIGKKTVEDITTSYPNKEDLLKVIKRKEKIPLRDDVAKILTEEFNEEAQAFEEQVESNLSIGKFPKKSTLGKIAAHILKSENEIAELKQRLDVGGL